MIEDLTFRRYWLPAILSLFIGCVIGWIDSGKNWDDAGITAAAIFSIILGIPCLRLKGDYLAITTLGFG